MKEAVTKVIDTLTQEDFDGALQKLLERYNKCIAAVGGYFEGDKSFMCVLSIKVPIRKKSGNLFNDPRMYTIFFSFLLCVSFLVSQLQKQESNLLATGVFTKLGRGPEKIVARFYFILSIFFFFFFF